METTVVCRNCGRGNPASNRFCGGCGHALPGTARSTTGLAATDPAERRQLSVMFCDLVGSTSLSATLDPEDLREVVRAYQEVVHGVLSRYEGYLAQYLGDGILAYFGYPAAHEDEAARSVRAGLEIITEIDHLNWRLRRERQVQLAVRIGVHTGIVVIGEMGSGARRERLAMGEVPNVAARFQEVAMPNTLVVSATTHRLVEAQFESECLGARALKGLDGQETVYRVLSERDADAQSRRARAGSARPVGREAELRCLLDRWEHAAGGEGQIVALCGEPGIGKTYLRQAFLHRIERTAHARFECRCSPQHQHTAFYPVVDLLHRVLNFYPSQPAPERIEMLSFVLERNGMDPAVYGPLFAALLSVPTGDVWPALRDPAPLLRARTLAALVHLLVRSADADPLLLVFEDLHWADPSTVELLGLLVGQVPSASMLLLLTYRPTFQMPWPAHPALTVIPLERLERPHVEAIIRQVARGRSLPAEVIDQVVARTDGVPLFVEELTRMILESGMLTERPDRYVLDGPLPPLAIPATLHDSLMARLDRLATAREVAQVGALLGREFGYELLRAVLAIDEGTLQEALARLVEAELLCRRGRPPQATYAFRHVLIQEAACQSLLRSTRQQYHHRIAQVIEREFDDVVETQPEVLAHHYTGAGLPEVALPYWHRAGRRALERSAGLDAIAHCERGLSLLADLTDATMRERWELHLLAVLGPALLIVRGYSAPEVEATFLRARDLCLRFGTSAYELPIACGLFGAHFARRAVRAALLLADELLDRAHQQQEEMLLVSAHTMKGVTLLALGRIEEARRYLEEEMRRYDPVRHAPLARIYGQDVGVIARCYLAFALWALGYPDQSLACSRDAVALGRAIDHPHSLAFALGAAATLHYLRREPDPTWERTEDLLALAETYGFSHLRFEVAVQRGWVMTLRGQADEAVRRAEEARRRFEHAGVDVGMIPWIIEAIDAQGRHDEALALLERELDRFRTIEDPWWWEAEFYALYGTLLAADRFDAALPAFEHAIDSARRQGARLPELRATLALARVLTARGRAAEARRRLAPLCEAFTEGADLPDLREARALVAGVPLVPVPVHA